ncbi:uncharacterized protein LOC118805988 isoform X2 [Colossoma macropomum]|uniref:uncharacterized protein LOC118805988 isoform X2 n=1 Tax=Colossoma macropomum TaxID=42526 RepID=UPI00186536D5|nr:uncharacterized protein LOC118805988 isoform X2 [Colossoma macropomum]XP_036423113.1 uncharacterized protein LOC118805988 isoform X2 [Colossoma macropomum]
MLTTRYFSMDKLLVILTLTGLLTSGVESFTISEKEYENIDRMLEFGVQVFLNCLDKVKEATEKLVEEDMLRTNRIAIQDNWNSFRETANRISVEERGKGVQDDLIVAARTVRRLVLHYKDDVKKIFHTVIMEQNVQMYLPAVNTFKGTIERAKANEIWGNLVSNYLPDAPSIESEPLEFLCYLLSTSTVETYIVNVLKCGVEVISQIKKIDFDEVTERVRTKFEAVFEKLNEIRKTEREKEEDDFLLLVSVVSRAFVFYWESFLNATDTPELQEKYEVIERKLKEQNFEEELKEVLKPIMESETVNDVLSLHFDFTREFYEIGISPLIALYFTGPQRFERTVRTVGMSAVVHSYTIYEQLSERGLFSEMKRLYFRGVDIGTALAGNEEIQYFRETYFEKWKSFREELNTLVNEERGKSHILLPQVRAVARMLIAKFEELVDKVNADIDDDTVQQMSTKWSNIKEKCIKKLLTSGALTQDQLDEAQSIFLNDIIGFYDKYLEFTKTMDPQRVEDTSKFGSKFLLIAPSHPDDFQ